MRAWWVVRWLAVPAAVVLLAAVVSLVRRPVAADALDWMTEEEVELADWVLGERVWNRVDEGDPLAMILDGHLTDQAQRHASRMATCSCTYHSPVGERYWWLQRGWRTISENVAGGFADPWAAHVALMRSDGHLHNILDPTHRGFGVAIRRDAGGRVYVAEVFGGF